MIPEISIEQYNYDLPDERIAKYPLSERDLSKLLVYKGSEIVEKRFPANCIPSPESPENRTTTWSNSLTIISSAI